MTTNTNALAEQPNNSSVLGIQSEIMSDPTTGLVQSATEEVGHCADHEFGCNSRHHQSLHWVDEFYQYDLSIVSYDSFRLIFSPCLPST